METSQLLNGLYNTTDLPSFLLEHIATAEHLYKPIDEYVSLIGTLRDVVGRHFLDICPLLSQAPAIIDKHWINDNRPDWELSYLNCFENSTSGTTSERFKYRIDNAVYNRIELFEHYIFILREFFVVPTKILYFVADDIGLQDPMVTRFRTDNAVMTHGMREAIEVVEIKRNLEYFDNHHQYYTDFFDYLETEQFELFLLDGNAVSEIADFIRKTDYSGKLCKLLSTTSCSVVDTDLEFLRQNGFIDNWCDHMRCWDGGVTFFSCKHRTRHLVEHFSYPYSVDEKLVSQDFFSFPNPFWNYYNGDRVSLGDEYRVCQCGRVYRDFKLTREREILNNGVISTDVSEVLDKLDCLKRFVMCSNIIKVFTTRSLSQDERRGIRNSLPDSHLRFVVEV